MPLGQKKINNKIHADSIFSVTRKSINLLQTKVGVTFLIFDFWYLCRKNIIMTRVMTPYKKKMIVKENCWHINPISFPYIFSLNLISYSRAHLIKSNIFTNEYFEISIFFWLLCSYIWNDNILVLQVLDWWRFVPCRL